MSQPVCPTFPGSHAPVYFYEFQHQSSFFKDVRPSYVKADHGDEILFLFRNEQSESSWVGFLVPRTWDAGKTLGEGSHPYCTNEETEAPREDGIRYPRSDSWKD